MVKPACGSEIQWRLQTLYVVMLEAKVHLLWSLIMVLVAYTVGPALGKKKAKNRRELLSETIKVKVYSRF